MRHFHLGVTVSVCTLACLLSAIEAPAQVTNSDPTPTQQSARRKPSENAAVTAWFKEYDQIRRNAESTTKEKFQAMSFGKNEPNKENSELATRMLEKYSAAAAAMKQLEPQPETSQLQEGYTQYFSTGRHFFADYLEAQKVVPFSKTALLATKKKLQRLDKTNKRIDSQLRKQFRIPKHRHIEDS